MSTRFAGLIFFALAAIVTASPVPCETATVTVWAPFPVPTEPSGINNVTSTLPLVPTIPVAPTLPITIVPLPTGISSEPIVIPPLSTVDPTWVPPVSSVEPSLPLLPTISLPTGLPPVSSVLPTSLPLLPTISVPVISVPVISVPPVSVPTLPTISLPTGGSGNAPTETGSAPTETPTAPWGGNGSGNGNGNGGGKCNTGPVQCCNTVARSDSPEGQQGIRDALNSLGSSASQGLLSGLLNLLVSGINVPVGLNCSPITVLGIVGQSSCSARPVCCEDNSSGGLISIGCIPISL